MPPKTYRHILVPALLSLPKSHIYAYGGNTQGQPPSRRPLRRSDVAYARSTKADIAAVHAPFVRTMLDSASVAKAESLQLKGDGVIPTTYRFGACGCAENIYNSLHLQVCRSTVECGSKFQPVIYSEP